MNDEMIRQEVDPKDEKQSEILNAFASSLEPVEILMLLEDYESEFGQDTFWKMTQFDLAEQMHEEAKMKAILQSFDTGEISDVLYSMNQARIYYMRGDYQKARMALGSYEPLEDTEEALMYLHLKGISAFACGEYEEAAQCFEDLMLEFEDDQVKMFTAISYTMLQKRERAKEYFDQLSQQVTKEDGEWILDLLLHFDKLDLMDSPDFPGPIRKKVLLTEIREFNGPLENLEKKVRQEPAEYRKRLSQLLKYHPQERVLNYLYAVSLEETGSLKEAKNLYRKVMIRPCSEDLDDSQKAAKLEVRLFALNNLSYTKKVAEKHLNNMVEELHECSSCLVDLMAFCAIERYESVLACIIENYELPVPRCQGEQIKLDDGILAYFWNSDQFREALELVKSCYDLHCKDLFFIQRASILFSVLEHGFKPRFEKRSEYMTLSAYLQDAIIDCEVQRLEKGDLFIKRIEGLFQELKNDAAQKKYQEAESWTVFLNYLDQLQNYTSEEPELKGFFEEFYAFIGIDK